MVLRCEIELYLYFKIQIEDYEGDRNYSIKL
jgi:hypothetical protein